MIYLDYAATTPTRPEVIEAMAPYWTEQSANPSSIHSPGLSANQALDKARKTVARALHCPADHRVVFTSGGTESNNMALKGLAFGLKPRGQHLITTRMEHSAILEPMAWLESQGWAVTYLPVNHEGFIDPDDLRRALSSDTVLVSLMHGNNEVGTLQDLTTLAAITHEAGALFHTDAVQTVGKLPLSITELGVDALSASAHKFYGPKGVGFLTLSPQAQAVMTPLGHGGGHEFGFRSGTPFVPGIVGAATALSLALEELPTLLPQERQLQAWLMASISERFPQARLNGPSDVERRVPGNVNFSFAPMEGEALVLRMDMHGVAVSSGSACQSSKLSGSHVVHALGATPAQANGTVRFSLGRTTTMADLEAVVAALVRVLDGAGYTKLTSPVAMAQV